LRPRPIAGSGKRPPVEAPATPREAAPPPDDTTLIAKAQEGDAEAFDLLVRRYLHGAFAVAYRVVWHREDAEDLVQEGFLSALKHIRRFELGRPFAPWLFRIIVNRGLSMKTARRPQEDLGDWLMDRSRGPSDSAEEAEIRQRFNDALATLPERQRLAVEMVDVDGRTPKEVGEILAVTATTVRWYVHQARRTLRQRLKPLRESGEA
jgi:RNA polymerase sigma-70 factor (ECF subfamily)